MLKWLKLWPFLTTTFVAYNNVEFILIPTFIANGIRGWYLLYLCEVLGNLELAYYAWFFWWLGKLIKENPKLKEFYDDALVRGAGRVFRKLVKILVEMLLEQSKSKRLEDLNKNGKREGFATMFFLGVGIGTWLLGLLIFYANRSYLGLVGLFLGNITKIACFVLLANILGWWFYSLITAFAIVKAYKFISPKIKNKLREINKNFQ
ncbi:MAG: hypothetical protein A3B86_03775 [Candidatus Yanofskybacteria bacterium RIFCSPHIGHO2_02_FULL_38_22b]|uniref:Uncharacterized protein n=1 Tax=Candidatus Yanofskybacteria bacterium RIFCSPHIGHO2_02_FULL_38_22b TaxID=1802673 RepID=A0A1F8EZA7_9BACT|nr:MAG: hypothetical protein A2816_01540 [Candidatus Yanofskybacteria bacterium RIFCSPHIGHO2_01_FULL_39_44]OGN06211.1 MAG: hypothetical protein A3B86_03775 [Candidatus Yanofskybacteria bacterium RIFCSPHIGHO2_02_FULL_38_22b]OGN19630.1 MAG: hypothetical protein A2910_03505 [Candidatus Yanofskybacteria bacterium RIFCSPLOWO2_01_FULL_39_28]